MHVLKQSMAGIMSYYKEQTPGSWVKERHCSLVFHYADTDDPDAAALLVGDYTNHINDTCVSQHVHAVSIKRDLVVEPGTAATQIFDGLDKNGGFEIADDARPDFLVVGDDGEGEPGFRWANQLEKDRAIENVTTVSMGS